MAKVLNFTSKKNETNKTKLKIDKSKIRFSFKVDENFEELYINFEYGQSDINVDVGINLSILDMIIKNYPMFPMTKENLKNITGLEDNYIDAIFETYLSFGFIDKDNLLPKTISEIRDNYIEKRLEIGYPKDRKLFKKVIALEQEVFGNFVDVDSFSEELYWKAKRY